MLTPNGLLLPAPPLLLHLEPHRLALDAQHRRRAVEQPLVQVGGAAERQVAAAEDRGAGQAEYGAGNDARHAEGEADVVARRHEVGIAVDVDGRVVGGLGGQDGEEGADLRGYRLVEGFLGRVQLVDRG